MCCLDTVCQDHTELQNSIIWYSINILKILLLCDQTGIPHACCTISTFLLEGTQINFIIYMWIPLFYIRLILFICLFLLFVACLFVCFVLFQLNCWKRSLLLFSEGKGQDLHSSQLPQCCANWPSISLCLWLYEFVIQPWKRSEQHYISEPSVIWVDLRRDSAGCTPETQF